MAFFMSVTFLQLNVDPFALFHAYKTAVNSIEVHVVIDHWNGTKSFVGDNAILTIFSNNKIFIAKVLKLIIFWMYQ